MTEIFSPVIYVSRTDLGRDGNKTESELQNLEDKNKMGWGKAAMCYMSVQYIHKM